MKYESKLSIGDVVYFVPRNIKNKTDVYILQGNVSKVSFFKSDDKIKVLYNVTSLKMCLNLTQRRIPFTDFCLFDEIELDRSNELAPSISLFFSSKEKCESYIKRRLKCNG